VEAAVGQLQELMWKDVGIVRTGNGLKQAISCLEEIGQQISKPRSRREYEARNLQIAGLLVARSALAREESRGAHYRTDYPDHNDLKFGKHSVALEQKIRFE
jgi:L-aspartate oxidase